ncbi:MAG TPA: serine hydrolase [Pyrinomonadaceae bacterium]|nr:serine hydrolase [Pyrinomonadaceae bacterium]
MRSLLFMLALFTLAAPAASARAQAAPAQAPARTKPAPAPESPKPAPASVTAKPAPESVSPATTPAATPAAAPAVPEWLDRRVRAEVSNFSGTVSLYAKNLDTGAVYSYGGDDRVRTASTIKVAIMVEAFARVAEGRATWADELTLTKEKKVSGSGVLKDLSDGLRLTLRDAVTLMITVSDNTATNLALDHLSADAVNRRMESLGLSETRSMRKVGGGGESAEWRIEANKRFGLGRSTPREMVALLELMERGELVGPAASKEMIELLRRQQYHDGIFRYQWQHPVANKTGALDRLRADVGIIYHPRGRIALAVTCDDMPETDWTDDNPALHLMSRLSRLVVDGLGK